MTTTTRESIAAEVARYAGCPTGCGTHLNSERGHDADNPHLDARDAEILRDLRAHWAAVTGPRVGDFVRFADSDRLHRFSADHQWTAEDIAEYPSLVDGLQTTPGGSFHLGRHGMSYSGGLDSTIPRTTLTDTGETRLGGAWFFHHGWSGAHRGVDVRIECRVYATTATAPKRFNSITMTWEDDQ